MLSPHIAAFSPDASVKSLRSCWQSFCLSSSSTPARYFRTLAAFLLVFSSAMHLNLESVNINVAAEKSLFSYQVFKIPDIVRLLRS